MCLSNMSCCPSPPVQVRGSGIVQGRAPPLVSGVDGSSTSNQSLQTLIVTAGGRVVEGGPGKYQEREKVKKTDHKSAAQHIYKYSGVPIPECTDHTFFPKSVETQDKLMAKVYGHLSSTPLCDGCTCHVTSVAVCDFNNE